MRRWLAGLVATGVLLAPSSAGALTLRVRHDGNDTRSVLDLERVTTGLTQRRALFAFATFEPFTIDDIGGGGRFQLDTKFSRGR